MAISFVYYPDEARYERAHRFDIVECDLNSEHYKRVRDNLRHRICTFIAFSDSEYKVSVQHEVTGFEFDVAFTIDPLEWRAGSEFHRVTITEVTKRDRTYTAERFLKGMEEEVRPLVSAIVEGRIVKAAKGCPRRWFPLGTEIYKNAFVMLDHARRRIEKLGSSVDTAYVGYYDGLMAATEAIAEAAFPMMTDVVVTYDYDEEMHKLLGTMSNTR